MNAGQTRFFCRCGRLLTVDASVREVSCPTCRQQSVVPRFGAPEPPPPPRPAPAPGGSATAVLSAPRRERLGRFELLAVLGRGGMGTVWRARDAERGVEVALKVLHPALEERPDFVSRFQREARTAAGLRHRNVVQVIDSGIEDGTPWLAMELVDGEDLLAAAQRGALGPENVVPVAIQAARGLLAAAEIGLTHRDVKPGNLLLRGDGTLKVADFGLAKAVDSESRLTVTGEILGTPHYMAPEQGRGERVDHRADLYALGASIYHVLGGAPPHDAETPVAVILKHLREEPLPLRRRNPRVAPGLERVVHRLLQKDPEQRYQTHVALIEDLERLAAGREPIGGAEPPLRRVQEGATTYVVPHEATTELVLEPAGGLRRLLALAIDLLAIEALLHVLAFAWRALPSDAGRLAPGGARILPPRFPDEPAHALALAATGLAATLAYLVAADARGGRTIGKRWLRLRVCRRDGRDLGALAAAARLLFVLPALVLMAPTLTACAATLLRAAGATALPEPRAWIGAGAAWLLVLDVVGRMAGFGRALHDGLTGAVTYVAKRPLQALARAPGASGVRSPGRALRLSIVPGIGLMYAGHPFLGIATIAGMTWFVRSGEPQTWVAIWLLSGFAAHALARQRNAARPAPAPPGTPAEAPPAATPVRRQET